MSEHDSYYGYGENSIVELAESLKFQSQRLDQAKSWAAVIPDAERHIEAIKRRMLELLAPESPQDTDSTETMIEALPDAPTSETLEAAVARVERTSEAERDQLRASEPVLPMADLSGVEIQPLADQASQAFNYYKPNGSLPETD